MVENNTGVGGEQEVNRNNGPLAYAKDITARSKVPLHLILEGVRHGLVRISTVDAADLVKWYLDPDSRSELAQDKLELVELVDKRLVVSLDENIILQRLNWLHKNPKIKLLLSKRSRLVAKEYTLEKSLINFKQKFNELIKNIY